jgi:TetR/AcrR family transcriptional repressor of nem operon
LRGQIIESGVDTLHRRGFAASGVREITSDAGVPQGSFTNHFRSKEAFGAEVLDRYFERVEAICNVTLSDITRPPHERLRAYFEAVTNLFAGAGWRRGCMISNMSLETADHSELLRGHLQQIFGHLTERFADVLRAAQAAGSVREDIDCADLSDVLLAAWHGAIIRMRVDRDPAPLERFKRVFIDTLLVS